MITRFNSSQVTCGPAFYVARGFLCGVGWELGVPSLVGSKNPLSKREASQQVLWTPDGLRPQELILQTSWYPARTLARGAPICGVKEGLLLPMPRVGGTRIS